MRLLHYLVAPQQGIPVLMYHHILPGMQGNLNTPPDILKSHLSYLKEEGYDPVSLSMLCKIIAGETPLPAKPVHITFDDGYFSQVKYAYPLMKAYQFKGSLFVIGNRLVEKQSGTMADDKDLYAGPDELRSLDPCTMELALHSNTHPSFASLSTAKMKHEIIENISLISKHHLPYQPYFAYPYGSRPPHKSTSTEMKEMFRCLGLKGAFRIGNAVQSIPASDPFEMTRIHVSGQDDIDTLKIKLRKGKLRPF